MALHKAFAEISLKALSGNLREVRKRVGRRSILAVVKADAYGHGAIEISRLLINNRVSMLGVAFIHEAVELREAGINTPILVFFDTDNPDKFLEYDLIPAVFDLKTAKRFSTEAYRRSVQIPVHIKIDTGMGRVGVTIGKALKEIPKIACLKNIKIEGLMSHFPDADSGEREFTMDQIRIFRELADSLKKENIRFRYLHMANSAAVLDIPESHMTMVRPGIMLYGYGLSKKDNLKPVMSLKSRILFLKKVPAGTPISYGRTFITKRRSTIATIPVGYADGYSRRLSNNGEVIINGRKAPVVGRVCMDTIMADVTDIPGLKQNPEVILIGSQGRTRITAQDIAERTGTIPYEVLTSIGDRVKRVYK